MPRPFDDLPPGSPVALVVLDGRGYAFASPGRAGRQVVADPWTQAAAIVAGYPRLRWTWWSARDAAPGFLAAGVRPARCWDLGAVGALLQGLRRDDPAAIWAAAHGLPEPFAAGNQSLFDPPAAGDEPVGADGQLSAEWAAGGWSHDLATAQRWATLTLDVQQRQDGALRALPDPRHTPTGQPLSILTAQAESATALLCVELERGGLPLARSVAAQLLTGIIGPRPVDSAGAEAAQAGRTRALLQHFPGAGAVDPRSPEQVRGLLARVGLDLPDTRSWRLEPHAATSPAVAALIAWRKADRVATTYGWRWLDAQVGADDRLRGPWRCADGAAGRMTAGAGLHNMPAELRPAVRAAPGFVFVGADLGQVEPRVLAAISRDARLAEAARADDMYAPVAAALLCDRPTAKIAVLAAMYGQTSGAAGAALKDMDRTYPDAMAYLRRAEAVGRDRGELRTYGGRLVRFGAAAAEDRATTAARGRYARNASVQGAAAELFKAWAVTVRAGLDDIGGEIVLCLHDELLLHVPETAAPQAESLLRRALAATARWWSGHGDTGPVAVQFVADIATGRTWPDVH